MKLLRDLTCRKKVLLFLLGCLILIGVISANGNFKINTDGTMECTGAKIEVQDNADINEVANIIAESANYIASMQSNGFFVDDKNTTNANFVMVMPDCIVALDENRYGFDFAIGSDGRAYWTIKDSSGKLLQTSETQFNLYSPGRGNKLLLEK